MKNTNAKIRIKSKIDNDGEITEMDTVTKGRYEIKNGKYYIVYKEEELSEMRGCSTTIKVNGDNDVIIKRSGNMETSMRYEQGASHSCVYSFSFGSIIMETHTQKINVSLNESGGVLELIYELETGSEKSFNHVVINVEKEHTDEENNN